MSKFSDTVSLSVRIPHDLYSTITVDAKVAGETISTIVRRRLKERYSQLEEDRVKKEQGSVSCNTFNV